MTKMVAGLVLFRKGQHRFPRVFKNGVITIILH